MDTLDAPMEHQYASHYCLQGAEVASKTAIDVSVAEGGVQHQTVSNPN